MIFMVFVLSRAIHPMIIDLSKADGKVLYSKNAPAMLSQLCSLLFVNLVALFSDGFGGVAECWKFKGLGTFGLIGLWYAFGDFLEMLSMGSMGGGVYQVLLQSKLLITALMMRQMRGQNQSELQWYVLLAATLAVSAFVIVDSGGDSGGSMPLMGVVFVMAKVAVSCYAGVLSDQKLKGFASMSMSAKLSQMSLARVIASVFLQVVMERSPEPWLHDFNMGTWLVVVSFTTKSLITLYLLKVLDSIQKNIGEAFACIVIFFGSIVLGSSSFDLCAFLLALLVVILVRIYGMAGKVVPKAALGPTPVVELENGKNGKK